MSLGVESFYNLYYQCEEYIGTAIFVGMLLYYLHLDKKRLILIVFNFQLKWYNRKKINYEVFSLGQTIIIYKY